jgi:hypothetical protein
MRSNPRRTSRGKGGYFRGSLGTHSILRTYGFSAEGQLGHGCTVEWILVKKILVSLGLVIGILALGLLFRFGTLSPCGILTKELRSAALAA